MRERNERWYRANIPTLDQLFGARDARIAELETALTELLSVIGAHNLESLNCDGTDDRWCDCLKQQADRVRAVVGREGE